MKKFFKVIFLGVLGFGIAFFGLPTVYAQETEIDEFTLEEITVTAEKREVNVQDTAVSVAAITGAEIRDKAIVQIDNALRDVAGVDVGGVLGGAVVFIRGVGSFVSTEVNDPSTALMLDGVYAERAEQVQGTMFDISRVEVLRGPQGTLYGRNAIAGTVNVISNPPSDRFEAIANFTLGNYNLKHADGALNIPISDNVAARLAFLRDIRDGYISNGTNNSDKFSFRAKLSYKPTDKLSFLLTYERYEDEDCATFTVPVPGSAGTLPPIPGMWAPDFDFTAGWVLPMGADEWTTDEWHTKTLDDMLFNTFTLQMDWDLEWGQLTFIPSYSQTYRTVGLDPVFGAASMDYVRGEYNLRNMDGFLSSGELRLASPADSPIKWLVGLYMLDSDNKDSDQFPLEITTDDNWEYQTYNEPRGTKAIFGQATYPVTERFRLTAGFRYNDDYNKKQYRFANGNITDPTNPYYDLATVTADGYRQYDSGIMSYEGDFKKVTYKGGFEYDFSEDSMLYAHISTGYKAGGLNSTVPPDEFNPEELVAYEIGSKNRFLDERLQVNMEAFYYDYKDLQVQISEEKILEFTGETASVMKIGNAETNSTSLGGEIETDYLLTPNDRLKVTLAYLDTEYGKITLNDFGRDIYLGGTQIANSPKWTGTLGYEHAWSLEDGTEISASFDTKISAGYWATIEKFRPGAWQERFHRSNAYVNYRSANGRWTTSLWMKNIENKAQTTFIFLFYRKVITDPRTIGVSISFRY